MSHLSDIINSKRPSIVKRNTINEDLFTIMMNRAKADREEQLKIIEDVKDKNMDKATPQNLMFSSSKEIDFLLKISNNIRDQVKLAYSLMNSDHSSKY